MAVPILTGTRSGVLFVWAGDPDVDPSETARGWVPLDTATARPGADLLEVASYSGEDEAALMALTGPARHYETARRAVRRWGVQTAQGPAWKTARELSAQLAAMRFAAVFDLSILAEAIADGEDPTEAHRARFKHPTTGEDRWSLAEVRAGG